MSEKEYIEREAAIKTINKLRIGLRTQGSYEFDLVAAEAKHRVESIPAADVVEVRHAKWIGVRLGDMRCSLCGEVYGVCGGLLGDYNYCPNCGAKMDGGPQGLLL